MKYITCPFFSTTWVTYGNIFIGWNQISYFVVDFPTHSSENDILFALPSESDNQIIYRFIIYRWIIISISNICLLTTIWMNSEGPHYLTSKSIKYLIIQNKVSIFVKYHPLYALNSLWPSDVLWWQGSRSTLAQVMACCLTAPNHFLNQCWLITSKV